MTFLLDFSLGLRGTFQGEAAGGNTTERGKVAAIDTELENLVRRIEILGEQGAVDEAMVLNNKMDELKKERKSLIEVFIVLYDSASPLHIFPLDVERSETNVSARG